MKPTLLFLFIPALVCAQTAAEIMAKVAENQSRAEAARAAFIYHQSVLVRLQRTDGKLSREEARDYAVTPQPDGVSREMTHFQGKYVVGSKEVTFSEPGEHYKNTDIDADLAKSLADDFGGDEQSRDGINTDLFPLTSDKQKHYDFALAGSETWHGRDVFRVTFDKKKNDQDTHWAGEALIDKQDLAPVMITTHLSRGIPVLVKTLLGTNIQQLGFKVTYGKFDEGLWFPVTYSGEMKVRLLFAYARNISMGMTNSDFRKADVQSTIAFEDQH